MIAPADDSDKLDIESLDITTYSAEKKSIINIPEGTDPKVVDIIGIYLSNNTDKEKQLEKFSKGQLTSAWELVIASDKGNFQPRTTVAKNVASLVKCLSGDTSVACVKQSKKVNGGTKSIKYTRKK